MKIGFDAKRALLNHSGLGNFSRTLIKSFYKYYPENNYYLFTPKLQEQYTGELTNVNTEIITPTSFLEKRFHSYWRSYKIASTSKNLELDIYHGLSHELPVGIERTSAKTCVTIHDLIFERFPDHYPYIDRVSYRKKIQYACNIADSIIAISEQTKNDLIDFYKIDKEKIQVIYQGCDILFGQANDDKKTFLVKHKFNLPDEFILHVGSFNKRKNHLKLLEAYKLLNNNNNLKIVFVGNGGSEENAIRKFIHANDLIQQVLFIQKATNEELSYIYKQACMLVYNSLFEGFGIPILEAFASEIPVITSIGSCFNEVGADACIYVDPLDASELAKQINHLIEDHELRDIQIKKGQTRLTMFNNDSIAHQYMSIYQSLLTQK
ncbi:MAG: glycosyltransferase family 1 protein [Bacteroidota bacterium]